MKAIQIESTGSPEVLESGYVRTLEQLTAIMDAVFGMYLAKDLEVLVRPAYAFKDAAEVHRDLKNSKSNGELVLPIEI